MPVFEVVTTIAAPPERVFDCARDAGLHLRSLASTGERAVEGRSEGLLEPGEEVTWEGRHLLLRWRMKVRIVHYERPRWFRDVQVQGPFTSFQHDHYFEPVRGGTRMTDRVAFRMPLGGPGRYVGIAVVVPHLRRLLLRRNEVLRAAAEGREGTAPAAAAAVAAG